MLHSLAKIDIRDFSRAVAHQFKRLAAGMTFASRFEVRPAHGDGWMITQRGSSLPLRIFKKKVDAVREAKKLAQDSHAELNVFQRNGRVQSRLLFN
ncbi:MAG: DUF2188 domain-containing protein [Bdellovibrionota bacterium]